MGAFGQGVGAAAATALTVMLLTFALAVARGLHRIVDIAWGAAFAAVALVAYAVSAGRATAYGGSW